VKVEIEDGVLKEASFSRTARRLMTGRAYTRADLSGVES
jgi:2-methylaconitate cis-trans-isomerase PrpF